MVLANKSFNRMRKSMESFIKHTNLKRIVNTSPKGAKIAGTVYMDWPHIIYELSDAQNCRGIPFNQHDAKNSLRTVRRRVNAVLKDIEIVFQNAIKEIKVLLSEDLDEEKGEVVYDRLSRSLSHLTGSREYAAFIKPMVRNEDHLLGKAILDLPRMNWDEKKTFVSKDLMMYLRGVELSIIKLKKVMDSWGE